VGFSANFTFDYSKPRTARVRRLRGGKLPIGQITVSNARALFKKIKFSDLSATIKSDGVVAEGHIAQTKKYADILCDFTFNNTDSIHKMKIKPGLRLKNMPWQKKMTDEERAQKQEAKQKAKEEKLKAKEAKLKAKEEKRIEKEAEKEAKKAAKAARKAEKKAAKEQRKADKEAAKLAKKQLNS
jgi:DNA-directed RNA polymerase beta' subunit